MTLRLTLTSASVLTALALPLAVMLFSGTEPAQAGQPGFIKRQKLYPVQAASAGRADAAEQFGGPLPDLDEVSLAEFEAGRLEFTSVETVGGGLGPIFNGNSCAACHTAGAVGGAGTQTVTRFGRFSEGRFNPLESLGGSLLQAKAIHPDALERVPREANVQARRVTTPLFGAGLIEAIPDSELLLLARRPQPDGVRGKVAMVTDVGTGERRVGRFGWKAQQATLLAFSGDAYVNEMGITSRLFPLENAPNGRADLLQKYDLVPDVEDTVDPDSGKGDIDHAADFMRLLAPPPRVSPTPASVAGARLFERIRCTACHVPVLFTGANRLQALSHQPVPLFSDLLLHDMGRLGDGITQGVAGGRDMRTAPLWGLRVRPSFLHDGRARSITEAIQAHDGEGAASRQRFGALSPAEQQQLLAFLRSI